MKTTKTTTQLLCTGLLLTGGAAYADPCKVTIEGSDMMRFSMREIAVPAECGEVELTLKHSGVMPAKVMGHDWVLAKDSDMSGVVNAGMAAGAARGYLPENDKRIIAATKVVGGGETATVTFSTKALVPGTQYAFFCTTPGHSAVMRGKFLFGGVTRVAQAGSSGGSGGSK